MKIECLQHGRLYAVYAPSSFPLFITLVVTPVTQTNPRMSVVPDSCPATKSADHTFIPPSPYRAKPSPGNFWFGTDKLWTELRVTGTNSVEYVLTLITNDLQTHGRRWIDKPSSLQSARASSHFSRYIHSASTAYTVASSQPTKRIPRTIRLDSEND